MYLLFDIGGTKTRVAISTDGQTISEPIIFDTSQNFEEGIKNITDAANQLTDNQPIQAAAGGIREVLDSTKSMLINSADISKIPDWVGKPLREKLEESLKINILLENDSAMAALGEATHGAGMGKDIIAFLTVSTGVGGARIVKGRIDAKALVFEPGDQIIDSKETLVYLGDTISGPSLERIYGQKPENIDDPKIWSEVAKKLAVGLNNMIVFWSPDIVVLGGGVVKSLSLEEINSHLKNMLIKCPAVPPLIKASLGEMSGLFGALEYLKQKLTLQQ